MTDEELQQFIAANDSFGFEMRVCAILQRPTVTQLQHGATYSDPVTRYNRQFDFRFTIGNDRRRVLFALECKNIDPELPVIVCGRRRPKREAFVDIIVGQNSLSNPRSTTDSVTNTALYPTGNFVGKNVLKPERDGSRKFKTRSNDSEIHERWSQAIASAHDLIQSAAQAGSGVCSIVLPAVVVPDGALLKVEYDENGMATERASPIQECAFFIGHKCQIDPEKRHAPVTLSHLHFYTISGLNRLLDRLSPPALDWDQWIPDEILQRHSA